MMTYETMDGRTRLTFFKLKGQLGGKDKSEIEDTKLTVLALDGIFGPNADSELKTMRHNLDEGSYEKAEESFMQFCGVIGGCLLPRNTFG
jgi:hypothetical protein